jgi:hypothetical protein
MFWNQSIVKIEYKQHGVNIIRPIKHLISFLIVKRFKMNSETKTQNKILIKKMIFIYQALLDGWTIRMINYKDFEFNKSKTNLENNLEKTTLD